MDLNSKIVRTTIVSSVFLFAYGIASPYLTPFLLDKGFLKQDIAYYSSFAPLVLIFMSVIIGNISDTIGRKRTINSAMLLMSISYLAFLLMDKNYFLLAAALIISTIALEAIVSISMARVEDNVADSERGRATGTYETFRTIGIMSGTAVGSYIVTVASIPLAFKVTTGILFLLFIFGLFRKSHNHNKVNKDDFHLIKNLKIFLQNKQLRGMAIIGIGANFMVSPRNIFIPVLLIQDLNSNIIYVGLFTISMSIAHLSQYYWGKVCDVRGSAKTIIYSVSIWSVIISLMFFAQSPIYVIALGFLSGLTASAWNVSALCYLSKIGEKYKEEGLVVGSYSSLAYIGVFFGLICSGLVSQILDTRYVFLFLGAVGLLSVFASYKYITDKPLS